MGDWLCAWDTEVEGHRAVLIYVNLLDERGEYQRVDGYRYLAATVRYDPWPQRMEVSRYSAASLPRLNGGA